MSFFQSIILGIFQGVAEFLPISSSGHLLLFKNFMGLEEVPLVVDVVLHLATLLSIFVVFRKRIWGIITSCIRFLGKKNIDSDRENLAIVLPLLLATLVTAIIGFSLAKIDFSANTTMVSIFFILTGLMLFSTIFYKGKNGFALLKMRQGLITGIAQGIGVLPGISRSGITISAGMASGMDRGTAAEFSFLLAIPAIMGAFILEARDLGQLGEAVSFPVLLAGSVAAFVVGILALLILMPLVKKGRLAWFAAYLIPLGIVGLIFF